jgi:hypothetical protein
MYRSNDIIIISVIIIEDNMSHYFDNKTSFMEPQFDGGSHLVMTNVMKPKKIKYLNIDSRFTDEYNYNDTSFNETKSYTITLPERINGVHSIKVLSVEIPVSFYNISKSLGNNYFKIVTSTSISKMIVLADGIYTSSTLATEINYEMGLLGLTGISYQITNKKSVFSDTSSNGVVVYFDTDTSGNSDKFNFRSKMGWLLGFRNISYNVASVTGVITSESIVNLNTMRYLFLVVDEYNNSFQNSFLAPMNKYIMNKKILARISIDNQGFPFGTVLCGTEYQRCYNGSIDIQRLNLQLVNEFGIPVNFNGLDFSFLLEVCYE